MQQQNSIPQIEGKQRILIAPLNWGLGHATRCIPVIKKLLSQGHQIIIAADGYPLQLLKQEFAQLEFVEFRSFSVRYSTGSFQIGKLLLSLPKILFDIWREHRQLQIYIKQYKISYVISDNRFGLWTRLVPCVYITHQLMVKMPKRLKIFEGLGWLIHRFFINRYTACWIPDEAENGGLSGDLAHKYPLPKQARFIGCQSRFSCTPDIVPTPTFHTVVVVSGPEPQRSLFEKEWIEKLLGKEQTVLIIQGFPQQEVNTKQLANITLVSHLPCPELKAQLLTAKEIICRSGYSSIMDLHVLNKRATLIPTPGQTEQEYLAEIHA
ncbi:MAG: hypothetical protein JXQ69_00750 [Paludibacteraceae bacterium]|nr:hypothetical protein [Paludibacteraceae bacterium]MBN2786826.1 hypothetical protein [Paludibacteraceae bacterium]